MLHLGIKRLAGIAGVAAAALAVASASFAKDREVKVYNWSDYIDESILADFTKETGIKVTYDVFDSNEVLETKLLAGKTGYDIVVPTGAFLSRQIKAGVFQKLDKSKLTNIGNVWPEVAKRTDVYDPNGEHALTYMWGTTGIGYNEAKIKERLGDAPVNSWDLVFKPEIAAKFKDCGIFMLDSPDDILSSALRYQGIDPNTKDEAELKKGAELLKSIRPNVRKFHSSEYINALADGDICIAVGWSGDILQARDRAEEAKNGHVIKYSIPKEGAMMWFDMMAIPKDAENVAEAHEFLNYLLKPEVIAKASNYINYANGNLPSKEFISEEVKTDPAIYPDEATMSNLFVKLAYDAKTQRTVTRLWTGVVTGK
jgi:putrescine transport system substrate-binding protein